MTSSKQSFLANQDKCDQWNAVALQSWFDDVLVHVRGDLMEGGAMTAENMAGANQFVRALKTIGVKPTETELPKTPRIQREMGEPRLRRKYQGLSVPTTNP